MAAFVVFILWIPILGLLLRALMGSRVPAPIAVIGSLVGFALPVVVALALSDYLADRPGLVKPYRPKPPAGTVKEPPPPKEPPPLSPD